MRRQLPRFRSLHVLRVVFFMTLACIGVVSFANMTIQGTLSQLQGANDSRKLKSATPPEYPELARRMHISGVARVAATVNPKGSVIQVRELGGNPVLVEALVRAVKTWTYEPSRDLSTVEVKFEFKKTSE